jgi:hypothetical protein
MRKLLQAGIAIVLSLTSSTAVFAQKGEAMELKTDAAAKKKWYESFSIRGYVQARYNRLLETNDKLSCEQCDRSWGDNGGFFLRRINILRTNKQTSIFLFATRLCKLCIYYRFAFRTNKGYVFRFRS